MIKDPTKEGTFLVTQTHEYYVRALMDIDSFFDETNRKGDKLNKITKKKVISKGGVYVLKTPSTYCCR